MLDPNEVGPYLNGWYPGYGEDRILSAMPRHVRSFLAVACDECPSFLEGYLIPTLSKRDPYETIMADLDLSISAMDMDQSGLGDYSNVLNDVGGLGATYFRNIPETVRDIYHADDSGLGALIVVKKQSDFRKGRKAVIDAATAQAKAELAAAKAARDRQLISKEKREYKQELSAAKKIIQKAKLTKEETKALKAELGKAKHGTHWAFFKDPSGNIIATQAKDKKSGGVFSRIGRSIGRSWAKYGNVVITVAGAVLAPFTGGASLAAAAVLTAGNTLYYKKRSADKVKLATSREARRIKQEAKVAEADATRKVDEFYSQNQQWFADSFSVTPDKWSQLTLDQKLGLINAGATGRMPPGVTPVSSGAAAPGGGYGTQGGGGSPVEAGGAPAEAGGTPSGGQQVATSGMFDSSMLPLLVGGVALALIFGKPMKGGSKRRGSRRNPGRRRWRVA